jgi:hypothetical protein
MHAVQGSKVQAEQECPALEDEAEEIVGGGGADGESDDLPGEPSAASATKGRPGARARAYGGGACVPLQAWGAPADQALPPSAAELTEDDVRVLVEEHRLNRLEMQGASAGPA